jgi:hypothetical protein
MYRQQQILVAAPGESGKQSGRPARPGSPSPVRVRPASRPGSPSPSPSPAWLAAASGLGLRVRSKTRSVPTSPSPVQVGLGYSPCPPQAPPPTHMQTMKKHPGPGTQGRPPLQSAAPMRPGVGCVCREMPPGGGGGQLTCHAGQSQAEGGGRR